MSKKIFICGYGHCAHSDKQISIDKNEGVKVNSRYWHNDCFEVNENIKEAESIYLEKVSSSVVRSLLRKVINEIVLGNRLENKEIDKWKSNLEASRYLVFALNYALDKNIKISSPVSLYYLIDNYRVKEAWQKKKSLEVEKQIRKEADKDLSDAVQTEYKPKVATKNSGFGSIFDFGA